MKRDYIAFILVLIILILIVLLIQKNMESEFETEKSNFGKDFQDKVNLDECGDDNCGACDVDNCDDYLKCIVDTVTDPARVAGLTPGRVSSSSLAFTMPENRWSFRRALSSPMHSCHK